eukprot:1194635-Prorocentrum_minimum.AAC.3
MLETTLGHIGDYTVSVRPGDNLASQRLHLVILETIRLHGESPSWRVLQTTWPVGKFTWSYWRQHLVILETTRLHGERPSYRQPSILATTLGHIGDYTVSVRPRDNLVSQRLHCEHRPGDYTWSYWRQPSLLETTLGHIGDYYTGNSVDVKGNSVDYPERAAHVVHVRGGEVQLGLQGHHQLLGDILVHFEAHKGGKAALPHLVARADPVGKQSIARATESCR